MEKSLRIGYHIIILAVEIFCISNAESYVSTNLGHCSVCTCRLDYHPVSPESTSKLNIIDCSGLGLKEIPNDILLKHDVQVLLLNDNNIQLKSNANLPLRNLLALEIKNNNITYLPSRAFSGLVKLKTLNLLSYDRLINYVDDSAFIGLPSLESLKISISKIKENQLLNSSLGNLRNLTLVVDNDVLPDTILTGLNLLEFNLFANRVHEIPQRLLNAMIANGNEAILDTLTISSKALRKLPEQLLSNFLKTLNRFHLTTDFMSSLPDGFFQTQEEDESGSGDTNWLAGWFTNYVKPPSLKEIKLSGIKSYNDEIFSNLKVLQILHLQGIQNLTMNVFNHLHKLKDLIIIDCEMSYIEKAQFLWLNLDSLKISSCKLTQLQDSILKYNSFLKHLDLSHNQISKIEQTAFSSLGFDLVTLDLSYNKITFLEKNVFDFSELQILDLSYNEIEHINYLAFNQLDDLEELRLKGNRIKILPLYLFDDLIQIKRIDLQGNQIEEFHERLLECTNNLEELNLAYNKIRKIDLSLYPSVEVFLIGNPVTQEEKHIKVNLNHDIVIHENDVNEPTEKDMEKSDTENESIKILESQINKLFSTSPRPPYEDELSQENFITNIDQSLKDKLDDHFELQDSLNTVLPHINIGGSQYKSSNKRANWVTPVISAFCGVIIVAGLVSIGFIIKKKRLHNDLVVQEMNNVQNFNRDIEV